MQQQQQQQASDFQWPDVDRLPVDVLQSIAAQPGLSLRDVYALRRTSRATGRGARRVLPARVRATQEQLCPTREQCYESAARAIDRDDGQTLALICRYQTPNEQGTQTPLVNLNTEFALPEYEPQVDDALPYSPDGLTALQYAVAQLRPRSIRALHRCAVPVYSVMFADINEGVTRALHETQPPPAGFYARVIDSYRALLLFDRFAPDEWPYSRENALANALADVLRNDRYTPHWAPWLGVARLLLEAGVDPRAPRLDFHGAEIPSALDDLLLERDARLDEARRAGVSFFTNSETLEQYIGNALERTRAFAALCGSYVPLSAAHEALLYATADI